MKKAGMGLAGLVIGCIGFSGCQTSYPYNDEVAKIKAHHNAVKKIIGAEPNDSCHIYNGEKKGDNFQVIIIGENETRSITYRDLDGDGNYEIRESLTIPKKLDILGVIPDPNAPKGEFKKYIPEKKEKKKLFV